MTDAKKFTITNRYTGDVIVEIEAESLKDAVVVAVKRGANLGGADLRDANLGGADLRGAYLRGAKGINKYLTTPLYMLFDQAGYITMYKLVNEQYEGPQYGGVKYEIGSIVDVDDADIDEKVQCAEGINVATLDWCMREWREGYKILTVEFQREDIAAIPIGSDGKIRLHKCKVTGEKDLIELGLVNIEQKGTHDG